MSELTNEKQHKHPKIRKILHILNILQLSLFLFLLISLVVFMLNTKFFVKKYAEFLVIEPKVEVCDAIAVLSGNEGRYRLVEGVTLYNEGYGKEIILSGYESKDLAEYVFEKNGVSTDGMHMHEASSTYENAVKIKAYLDLKGYDSVLIVTSPAQSRRAKMVFDYVMPDIRLCWSYQAEHTYDPELIFDNKEIRENFTNEGMKYLYYLVEYGLK